MPIGALVWVCSWLRSTNLAQLASRRPAQIIEDAALHDQYCRVITPEPALNEEQEDVCAQLQDAVQLRCVGGHVCMCCACR